MQREGRRFPPERRHILKDAERSRWLPPDPILTEAGVRPGETVIDVGAGTGFWTLPLSRLVGPTGHVYAVDVEPIMLDELRALIQERRLTNAETVASEEMSVPMESGMADLAMLGFVLHEPPDPVTFLREVIRVLKPDGRMLVVDWQQRPTEHGPPLEHRISMEEAQALLGAAGLSVEEILSPTEDAYILLAREFRAGVSEVIVPTA